jgi:phosphoglycerate dehydrogenase-like enzyme
VEELGTLADLDHLLPMADHVVLCLPGTEHTRHLFDAARLGRMKAGACLYNVGRGQVVDEGALVELLKTGHLAGAGLDVFEVEPLKGFYAAEDYHQDYLIHNPHQPYIVFNDLPKIDALKRVYPEWYRPTPVKLAAMR